MYLIPLAGDELNPLIPHPVEMVLSLVVFGLLYFAMAGAGHEEHEHMHEYLEDEKHKKEEAEAAAHADDATPVPAH